MGWKPLFPVITIKFPCVSIKFIGAVHGKSVPATKQNRPATRTVVGHCVLPSAGGPIRLREVCPVQRAARLASCSQADRKPYQQRGGDGKDFGTTQIHSEPH